MQALGGGGGVQTAVVTKPLKLWSEAALKELVALITYAAASGRRQRRQPDWRSSWRPQVAVVVAEAEVEAFRKVDRRLRSMRGGRPGWRVRAGAVARVSMSLVAAVAEAARPDKDDGVLDGGPPSPPQASARWSWSPRFHRGTLPTYGLGNHIARRAWPQHPAQTPP